MIILNAKSFFSLSRQSYIGAATEGGREARATVSLACQLAPWEGQAGSLQEVRPGVCAGVRLVGWVAAPLLRW